MAVFIVVDNPKGWPFDAAGAEVVSARRYLTDPRFIDIKRARVFNLCRSYGYQTLGYYVSLLAAARGHKPLPSVTTVQELRQSGLARIVAEDINQKLQKLLAPLESDHFDLSIYFGRNTAKRYDQLSQTLFNLFPAPLLRAEFVRSDQWQIQTLRVIAADDIPDSHRKFVIEQAQRFFARPRVIGRERARYKLAILVDPDAVDAPSDERAIRRFIRAAAKAGIAASVIGKQDFGRVAEFDGLFLRETTAVNHHTYRFAVRAAAEGLVVIDDPDSIVKCTNKVYQAELFALNEISCPRTLIVHRDNAAEVGQRLGFPCVLKKPDSSFSAGVVKVEDADELTTALAGLFKQSELVVAQSFLPSQFDWRIGILAGKPLFAARYFMARGHWQIQKVHGKEGQGRSYGKVEAMALEAVPEPAVALATRAANLIGQGFYGVDLKEVDGEFFVMEINDNPNVEAGYEDTILKDALYAAIIDYFLERFENRVAVTPTE
jgi:glutathione synthase/RimK-type ligase-like ATP-grasp enzyme